MNVKYLIVHCSATIEGKDFRAKDIDKWHKQQGWSCIGYHYIVDLDGTVEKGRDESKVGAHCYGHNSESLGICYIGGLAKDGKAPKDTRTDAQRAALIKLLKELKAKYPKAKIVGHNQFAKKACPCFDAESEYKNL